MIVRKILCSLCLEYKCGGGSDALCVPLFFVASILPVYDDISPTNKSTNHAHKSTTPLEGGDEKTCQMDAQCEIKKTDLSV